MAITHVLIVGNATYAATVGFDQLGRPHEGVLAGAKSEAATILADCAVALSVALQGGGSAEAMAGSVGRASALPSSIIGSALQLVAEYERAA